MRNLLRRRQLWAVRKGVIARRRGQASSLPGSWRWPARGRFEGPDAARPRRVASKDHVGHNEAVRLFGVIAVMVIASGVAAADLLGLGSDRRVGSSGVSLAVPASWRTIELAPAPPRSGVVDPVTRVAAASSAIRWGRGCNDVDYVIGPKAVAIVILEWMRPTPGVRWAPRPGRFTSRNLPVRKRAVECFQGAGGSAQFAHRGRRFAAFVLAGPRASAGAVEQARGVLDSLRISRRP
jgi:hypothetical protein